MRIDSVFADIASNLKNARVERRTKSRLAAYRHSPELTYSRLYGYRRNVEGKVEIVPSEAEVIRLVFELFGEGLTSQEIKKELDRRDLRNRAGYRWTATEIAGLVRPIFAGLVAQRFGFKRSAVYEPILAPEMYKRTARIRVETAEIEAPGHCLGGRSWTEPSIARERDAAFGFQKRSCVSRTGLQSLPKVQRKRKMPGKSVRK